MVEDEVVVKQEDDLSMKRYLHVQSLVQSAVLTKALADKQVVDLSILD